MKAMLPLYPILIPFIPDECTCVLGKPPPPFITKNLQRKKYITAIIEIVGTDLQQVYRAEKLLFWKESPKISTCHLGKLF